VAATQGSHALNPGAGSLLSPAGGAPGGGEGEVETSTPAMKLPPECFQVRVLGCNRKRSVYDKTFMGVFHMRYGAELFTELCTLTGTSSAANV